MGVSKEYFEDFVRRLHYHRRGDGVADHCTRDAIFIVQQLKHMCGFDPQYSDKYVWIDRDNDNAEADARTARRLDALDDDGRSFGGWEKVYFEEYWEYVCAHFTRESAEAFIKRKGHDYDELRIWVDCQVYCPEYNAIVDGILDGKIVFKEAGDA
jgi:hypothetical protein